jgi:flagellar assembly factor FliW
MRYSIAVLTIWNVNMSGMNHCTIFQILSVENSGTDTTVNLVAAH